MTNQQKIEKAIKYLLEEGLEQNVENNPHLEKTPLRVAKAMTEIFQGYTESPYKYNTTFPNTNNNKDPVILGPINCYSMCSHHILPFNMDIYVGYIPNKKIIGISKIERITKNVCHKLQVQENIGSEIIQVLTEILEPLGVIVYITNSIHTCMAMRGIETRSAGLTTISKTGLFNEKEYEDKFFQMIKN